MSEQEMSEQPQPCPCCTGKAVSRRNLDGCSVICLGCGLRTRLVATEADAIAAWNKRATDFNPSEEEILAHQYEPSFVVKLPLEKRRELLRRQSEDYLQVGPIGEQPPTETTTYCSGCAEMATLKEELRLLEGIEDCIMEQESKDFDQAMELKALRKLREACEALADDDGVSWLWHEQGPKMAGKAQALWEAWYQALAACDEACTPGTPGKPVEVER